MAVPARRTPSGSHNFNKFRWEDHFTGAVQRGELKANKAILAMHLRRSLGTADGDCHVPVVWRSAGGLADLCDVSPKTFRGYRNSLVDHGLIFEIPSGKGSGQTLIVLKMPHQTDTEALVEARSALEAFDAREGTTVPTYVEDAIDVALANREAAATAEARDDDTEAADEQSGDVSGAFGKSSRMPLYNKKRTKPYRGGSGRDTPERTHEAPNQPSETQKPDQTEDKPTTETTRTVVDFETVKVIKATIVEMFDEYGRRLDEGVAVRLAKTYSRRGATPNDLRCTLDAKLMRLFGDGYGTGRVASFLLDDVDDWRPPPTAKRRRSDGEATANRRPTDGQPTAKRRRSDGQPTAKRRPTDGVDPTPMVLEDIADVWTEALDELATQVSAKNFTTWFENIDAGGRRLDNGTFVLLVSDPFYAEWIKDNYLDLIEDAVATAEGLDDIDIGFEIADQVAVRRPTD